MGNCGLNHAYRVVFNESLGSWVAVPESARGRGKRGKTVVSAAAALLVGAALTGGAAWAGGPLPTGGQVVQGSGAITQNGQQLTIQQGSDRLATNWQGFSIGQGHSVRFVQPSAQSVALNRVLGSDPSIIQGQLTANGQVFLLNPNGVLFTPTAQVNVGGLLASTLKMTDDDFLAGRYRLQGDSTEAVTNEGLLQAAAGGYVGLVAARVVNEGTIRTPQGAALLGAGQAVTLDLGGPVKLQIEQGALQAQITNGGAIQAAGGQVLLTAKAAGDLATAVINQAGHIEATTLSPDERGRIVLSAEGGAVVNTGAVRASGAQGGSIRSTSRALIDAGQWQATGSEGAGGSIELVTTSHLEQTAASRVDASGHAAGGSVRVTSQGSAWLSGQLRADSAQGQGGEVSTTAPTLTVAGATLTADGATGGGRVRVGGGWQGAEADVANARRTVVTASTTLSASATHQGNGGSVVVWSEQATGAAGSIRARGAGLAGAGGAVEVSSRGQLAYGAEVDVTAPGGPAGLVLLDPKNIVIDGSAPPSYSVTPLADPQPAAGEQYGSWGVVELANGNIVTSNPWDDGLAADAGAVRLYRPDGTLVSTLTGSTANDQVGNGVITALANGNYVVRSTAWDNGAAADAGAVTWGNGTAGVSGAVSAANSLVGSTANDQVGSGGVTALANGNYVVRSTGWDNGAVTNAGAVTWGNGTTGVSGAVSAANSLVGSAAGDQVGSGGVTALANGNYLVHSTGWDNGAVMNAGAVTWGSGTTGVSGAVSAANSLVGSTANDQVGSGGVTVLATGNYVVNSSGWDNGAAVNAGAVTWGSGTTGVSGMVSAANSLVGSTAGDGVGANGITVLTNGNYVVRSYDWDNGAATDAGAVTWGSGTTGVSGLVSAANSLVGSTTRDQVGSGGITVLANGNYVVRSTLWDNGAATDAGAVTWGSGTTGVSGVVSAANSLVGSMAADQVGIGGITALANGNYVVNSSGWDNGAAYEAGAVTWGSGTTGVSGVVSAANSLVGGTAGDYVGYGGITALTNGNYVVGSYDWDNGAATDAGAVTWGSGTTGVSGVVSATNSLVGGTAGDYVGYGGITGLANGNYVVRSTLWANGAGAVTWGSGTTGVSGAVSATNSLVGGTTGDRVGTSGITVLTNGNYVVRSTLWDNGAAIDAGAVTWGSGTTGVSGVVSAANSLVGSTTGDQVGNYGITVLANGNYVVNSSGWDNGAAVNAGAVTWGSGTTGVSGMVSAANSLVGSTAGDGVGANGITVLTNGNYVVRSLQWRNSAGAATWGSGTTGVSGEVSAANSLVGSAASDQVGFGITALANGNYVVASYGWDNGAATNAGAVTWGSGTTGVSGVVSAANSLVGSTIDDQVGIGGITALANGNYVVRDYLWDNGAATNAGAVTWGNGATGVTGMISAANSLVGSTTGDQVGIGGITALSDGRAVVHSPNWNAFAGRVDILSSRSSQLTGASFSDNPSATSTISAAQLKAILDTGAAVTLQANNDITVSNGITVDNATGNGGHLTLQAGRSILVNASITTDNGNLTLIANERAANGVQSAYRDAGAANITMASGTAIQAGTGDVRLEVRDGAGNANNTAGVMTLAQVRGNSVTLDSVNFTGSVNTQSKTYDGSAAAMTQPFNLGGLVLTGSNLFAAGPSASFDSKNAGFRTATANGAVQLGGFNGAARTDVLKGGTAYVPNATGAQIFARTLTMSATGQNRVYDGTTAATVSYTVGNRVGLDDVSVAGSAGFGDKDVGTGKAVSISGLTLGGADAGNYQLAASTASTTADIAARTLTVTAAGQSKTYDGTTAATVSYGNDKLGSDDVTVSGTAAFGNKNVGTGKAVTVTGLTLGGADAGNYQLAATTGSTAADITARTLNVIATGQDKVYDATTAAIVTLGSDKIGSDDVTVSATAAFGDKNAGTGKAVSVTGLTLAGADAGNYQTAGTTTAASASITPRPVALSGERLADGTPVFLGGQLDLGNLLAGDTVSLTGQLTAPSASAGTYTSALGNTLASSNPNYAPTGPIRLVITAPPPVSAPVQAEAQAAAPVAAAVATAIAGGRPPQRPNTVTGLAQDDGAAAAQEERTPTGPAATLTAAGPQQLPGLSLQVIQGGLRLPPEAADFDQRQER